MVRAEGATLAELVAELRRVVGDEHVTTDPADLGRMAQDTGPWSQPGIAAVFPGDSDEVAEVVRVAGRLRVPLWPYSRGRNWGYGAASAYEPGALIVMLERLDRILHVDEELALAEIEPGVTQGQLQRYLESTHSRLLADVTHSSPDASVIGNALEHGVGYTPYSDHFGNLCGLEVVLANGEKVRTGGGPANSTTWHTYKWGTGPYLEGLFSQAPFGIVVRAGLWLMPAPEAVLAFGCRMPDEQSLARFIDGVRELALEGTVKAPVLVGNDLALVAHLERYPRDLLQGDRYLSAHARRTVRERTGTPVWGATGALHGTRASVREARREVTRHLGGAGKLVFFDPRALAFASRLSVVRRMLGASPEAIDRMWDIWHVINGVPGERLLGFAYFKSGVQPRSGVDPARDGAGLVWMPLVCPMTGRHALQLLEICPPICHAHGFDFVMAFYNVNPRTAVALVQIHYDRQDAGETGRAQELYEALADAARAAGYQQYRTGVHGGGRILSGNTEFQRLANAIKSALDPDNIIAPGRYGVGLPGD
jgi:4-cresol dehydrogenase (hydroxylating)